MQMIPPRRKGCDPRDRFHDFYIPEPNSGCWLWLGGLTGSGYGRFYLDGVGVQAHRYSWELHNGRSIPDGLEGCHICDNRPCVNPEHIFVGTQSDNLQDMVRKGRDNPPRGEAQNKARLTEEQIAAIRMDPRRLKIIGAEYGVDRSYIWKIKHGWYWAHSNFLVPSENNRQKNGRMFRVRGEAHHKAILTTDQARSIRTDPRASRELGRIYGVSKNTILSIRRGTIWKYV